MLFARKPTPPGSIILLNGASSAGKSTLAKAVQATADVPLLRYSLDFFFAGEILPRRGEGAFAWASVRPKLFQGYYGCVAALARAGNDLVVDHIFEDEAGHDAFTDALEGIEVFFVGVHCPLPELERRERERGDRGVGDARRDLETVHSFCDYHLDVDSTQPPAANAERILTAWKEWLASGTPQPWQVR